MTIKEVLDRTTTFFKEKKFDSPRLDAEILISSALGLKRIDLYLKFESILSENEINLCRDFVKRRSSGEPVAYIIGNKDFFGENFLVNKSVLIPRPETEILVEKILAWVKRNNKIDSKLKILDIGTGSGCIGISLLKNIKNSSAVMIDLSKEAIEIAKQNSEKINVSERSVFLNENADDLILENEKFDIIVANPPYIAHTDNEIMEDVKKFEPHSALFSEESGLQHIKKWSSRFIDNLSQESIMAFEFGNKQASEVQKHFLELNRFKKIDIIRDLSDFDRHIIGYESVM